MKRLVESFWVSFAIFMLQAWGGLSASELANYEASHSELGIHLERDALVIGETTWLAAHITPREGWHSYWKNPGDSGAAPIFEFSKSQHITYGTPVFAAPSRIPVEHLMNYGYKGSSTILIPLTVDAETEEGLLSVSLTAEWLVCDIECVPQVAGLTLRVTAAASAPYSHESRDLFIGARAAVPELAYWDSKLVRAEVSSELYVFADPSELEGLKSVYFFPEDEGIARYAAEQTWSVSDMGLHVRMLRDRGGLEPKVANGVLQLDFDGQMPQFYALEPHLKPLEAATKTTSQPQVKGMPIWQAAIYAFVGGLILNLMPCVFPILSLKAFSFVAANYKSAQNRRKEGWAYTLGIWISFMVIVAALMALRAGGEAIGWGFQLQEPIFVGLLVILMVLVALSLAGLFSIHFGFEGAGQEFAGREGAQGAFFKGVLATLVATPCTAPLMAPAIGFALTQPIHIVIIVFSLLALGLALPFLMLSYSARVAAAMPRPGAWMGKVKQGLAFPMLLTAAWLIYVFDLQAGATATLVLMVALIAISFAVWLWGQSSARFVKLLAAFVIIASIAGLIRTASTSSTPELAVLDEASTYSEARLAKLLDEGKPVFVYFTAEWCITCKVNEKIALHRDETQAALKAKQVIVLKGDWTNRNAEIAKVLTSYGRAGVPLYLYFPAGQKKAIVLPELITASSIIDIL